MTDDPFAADTANLFGALSDGARRLFGQFAASEGEAQDGLADWAGALQKINARWLEFQTAQAGSIADKAPASGTAILGEVAQTLQRWLAASPLAQPEAQNKLWADGLALWEAVLGQYGIGPKAGEAGEGGPELPRKDRRFADPKWREQPLFALIHQSYLLLAEAAQNSVAAVDPGDPARREQLRFATRVLTEALSPSNIPLLNPVVLDKMRQTHGQSLVKGFEHLLADLQRGQLTHVDPHAFRLGENIAATPGKVVHETPLYQLIHYTPTTERVLETPLVIFPPWINRFYILDLSPEKSFIRWALDQGVSVFVVSWKSADASMAEVVWDDYIRAQIEAIDTVRARLEVKSVHTIGYCVAGTTLAATLAVLARRGKAHKVASATFFTAQVDFETAGELKVFIDDAQLAALERLSAQTGTLDGRYMAATFNLLRGNDLIWNYVVNNYWLGADYPAFDLLHWNGDVTNLPSKWHQQYLRDLYRDNKLVIPDALSADGTPIDLTRIETPAYVQAGREDHIAPAASVWKIMHHLRGEKLFLLAGSGHIAGVVNPPAAKKYQFWTNPEPAETLDQFIAGASETPGSWWPHWIEWLKRHGADTVKAKGKRIPGGKGEEGFEDAPGRYVKTR